MERSEPIPEKSTLLTDKQRTEPPPKVAEKGSPASRKANPVFDAVALGSFNMAKVEGKTGGRVAALVKEVELCTPDEYKASLAADLHAMYRWYKDTKPKLSAPSSALTICKYLAEWRVTKGQPDEAEWTPPLL